MTRAALVTMLLAACGRAPDAGRSARISEFGRYQGYSEERFAAWVRTSEYVTVRDGTRLAVDVIRPAVNGRAAEARFPVLWTHSRYHRGEPDMRAAETSHDLRNLRSTAVASDWALARRNAPSQVDGSPALRRLVKHGYVVVSVQVRGGGASFGRYEGLFSPAETRDAYDVMDWMVKQPWCDGNLGMFGGSYLGITQYMAASTKHPALKAIFPRIAAFDFYDMVYEGGIYRENTIGHWGILTRSLDLEYPEPPVDADSSGALRAQALELHKRNWNVVDQFRAARFRDDDTPEFAWKRHEPASYLEAINQSGVAAYHGGGWYDVFATDAVLWFVNYTGTDRLMMGPWAHDFPDSLVGAEQARVQAAEQHRWFDRWLKGIRNGVDTEPPIHYALMVDPGKWVWKTATEWPVQGIDPVDYRMSAGPSKSVRSVNDGLLVTGAGTAGQDRYRVDLTTTTGASSRWDNAVAQGPMRYDRLAENDVKSLTYTTEPLPAEVAVVGFPVVTLYASSDQPDADFYAVLSEVDSAGTPHYVTEGMLRASDRDTTTAPWNNLGLPWHRGNRADRKPLVPGRPVELRFALHPTATVFNVGHRIRVSIFGADADNTEKPPVRGRPTIALYRGPDHPSAIRLPVLR